MRSLKVLAVAAGTCMVAGATLAAGLSVVVVDIAAVVKAYDKTKTVEELLERQLQEFETEQHQMRDQMELLAKEFTKAQMEITDKALSDEARDEKAQALRQKRVELQEYENQVVATVRRRKQEISQNTARMHRMLVDEVSQVVADHAKDKGYGLVLDSSAVTRAGVKSVLYSTDRIDITESVIKLIEKKNDKED